MGAAAAILPLVGYGLQIAGALGAGGDGDGGGGGGGVSIGDIGKLVGGLGGALGDAGEAAQPTVSQSTVQQSRVSKGNQTQSINTDSDVNTEPDLTQLLAAAIGQFVNTGQFPTTQELLVGPAGPSLAGVMPFQNPAMGLNGAPIPQPLTSQPLQAPLPPQAFMPPQAYS